MSLSHGRDPLRCVEQGLTVLARRPLDSPPEPPPRRRRLTWNTSELKALSWTHLVLRDAAAWALTAMVVIGTLAVLVDVPLDGRGMSHGICPSCRSSLTSNSRPTLSLALPRVGQHRRLDELR